MMGNPMNKRIHEPASGLLRYLPAGAAAVLIAGPMVIASQQEDAPAAPAQENLANLQEGEPPADFVELLEAELADEAEGEDNGIGVVVVNGGNARIVVQGNIDADQELLKLLVQDGFAPQEIDQILGGRTRQSSGSSIDSAWPVRVIAEDDDELYLPMGMMQKVALESEETLALPFTADGPGMLTVAYAGGLGIGVEVADTHSRIIDWDSTRIQQPRDSPIRFAMVPISRAGDYSVRIGSESSSDIMLGAQWIPFRQTEDSPDATYLPTPDPETELHLVPGTKAIGDIIGGDEELSHLWCRFDAEENGQLIVLAESESPGADLTMTSFEQGHYGNGMEYVDSDLNGNVANEGITLHVTAGQTYYVRVNLLSDSGNAEVELRTGWLDDE